MCRFLDSHTHSRLQAKARVIGGRILDLKRSLTDQSPLLGPMRTHHGGVRSGASQQYSLSVHSATQDQGSQMAGPTVVAAAPNQPQQKAVRHIPKPQRAQSRGSAPEPLTVPAPRCGDVAATAPALGERPSKLPAPPSRPRVAAPARAARLVMSRGGSGVDSRPPAATHATPKPTRVS